MVTVVALPDSFLLVVVVVTVGMGAAARFTTANIPGGRPWSKSVFCFCFFERTVKAALREVGTRPVLWPWRA